MKRRTFFTTLLLFLLFFNTAILLVSVFTLRGALRAQKDRCLAEHYIIAASLLKDLQALQESAQGEESISELMRSYTYFTQDKKMSLALYQEGRRIFVDAKAGGDLPEMVDMSILKDETRTISFHGREQAFLLVTGRLPEPCQEYVLVCVYNMGEPVALWKQMKNTLYYTGVLFSMGLAICLLLLLNRIFRPLRQISEASTAIAAGNYENRLMVPGNDELGDMARSFNHMAEEVEKQMEALREASQQKQRFIDNFAHELRTPLTAIYGYAEYLQKAAVTEADKLAATQYIMSECRRMQKMAYQLLDLAMLRAEKTTWELVEVSALLLAVENTLRGKAVEKGVDLRCERQIDRMYGNRELLESLLMNLTDNAIKACGVNGIVMVKACELNGDKLLEVWDNGKGMTAEQLAHAKEAFYRADKARSRQEGGAGLGLSICEQIAALHDAKLEFFSKLGEGTRVRVLFTSS